MRILGLTGSIGMGKSTAAAMLRREGVPLHEADAAVHRLLARGGKAVPPVAAAFPGALVGGAIDRGRLGRQVFRNPAALRRLEAILHPMVREETLRFLAKQRRRGAPLVVLDIPLLFETGGEKLCDAVAVVSAPAWLQRQRVLRRPSMTEERFQAILEQQMPDARKRELAQFVVNTGLGKYYTLTQLRRIVEAMQHWPRRHKSRLPAGDSCHA